MSTDEAAVEDSGAGISDGDIAVTEEMEESGFLDNQPDNLIGEKVIRTVELEYETLGFQETTSHIIDTVAEYDAYIEYSNESSYAPSGISPAGQNRQYRRVNYLFRVPTESLDDFVEDLEGMDAYKLSEHMGTEDVTETYRDTEARIEVLENKEERLNELLEQAESIEDILQIENTLSETIAEREALQSRLDTFDELIDYTQVYVTVTERPRIANVRGENLSFWRRLEQAGADSFYAFYYFIQDVFIWLVYALPYLLIIGLIIGVIYLIKKKTGWKNR